MNDNEVSPSSLIGEVIPENVGLDLLTVIRRYGVDTVFGIPGTHNLELYRHLPGLGFRVVTNRHEQGAGYGADGWSRQTGLPGVVITTSGPGMLNALSAVGTAFAESRPMILITPGPSIGSEFADIGDLHETKNTWAAADAIAEWSRRVKSGREAVEAVHDAFEMFRSGRPRPVVIEVPLNVLDGPSDCPPELLEPRPEPEPAAADPKQVEAAAGLLAGAERPVILAGGGSLGAAADLRALAERLGAPVVTSLNGRAVLPESHPLSVGASLRLKAACDMVNEADVLLVAGSKIGVAEYWWGPPEPSGKVIRIDLAEEQLNKNLEPDLAILGDCAVALNAILQSVPEDGADARMEAGSSRAAEVRAAVDAQGRAWSPAVVACSEAIAAGLPDDPILGADSSQICYFGTANFVPLESPGSYLYMATYATLGYGIPASIGAKIGNPDRTVVCVAGDGSLMFSVQELITAAEQGLDLVVVCVDNGGYLEIEQNEAERDIDPIGVRLTQPDWAGLGAAFGGTGTNVTSAGDLTDAVRKAISDGGVQVLHVPLSLFEEGN